MNDLYEWIDFNLPKITKKLTNEINTTDCNETRFTLGISGKNEIHAVLDKLLEALFPSSYKTNSSQPDDLPYQLNTTLREAATGLQKYAILVLLKRDGCCHGKAASNAFTIITNLLNALPDICEAIRQDVQTAFNGDPAATSHQEIILSYPFIDAIATYRIANFLYNQNLPIIPRIMSERAHSRTGIDIHPGATIAPGFFIDHGTGVVIGETCVIGNNVKIYQGVTLGALSPFDKKGEPLRGAKRHPNIEDDVIIYANATILGGNTTIGKGSIIGGSCWITSSIPPNAVVYHKDAINIKDKKRTL